MKISSKYLLATLIGLLIVGSLAVFGLRQLSQSQPAVLKPVGSKGTAGIIFSRTNAGYTNELTMGVQWGYQWNTVFSKTHDVYSSTFPYQVVNEVRSAFRAANPPTLTNPVYIPWNSGIAGGCPGTGVYDRPSGMMDPTPAGQAALQSCVGDIASARPGMYWMLWNEPDGAGSDQDNISPSLAISYFVVISNTILKNDPTARLIVGNVGGNYGSAPATGCANGQGCGVYWLSRFITEGHTIGITVTDFIAGYGFHAYPVFDATGLGGAPSCGRPPAVISASADTCLLDNFRMVLKTGSDWLAVNDPGKELWLTEFNWWPGSYGGETSATQVSRLGEMCDELKHWPLSRYGWFYAAHDTSYHAGVLDLFQEPYTGALSPSGMRYAAC